VIPTEKSDVCFITLEGEVRSPLGAAAAAAGVGTPAAAPCLTSGLDSAFAGTLALATFSLSGGALGGRFAGRPLAGADVVLVIVAEEPVGAASTWRSVAACLAGDRLRGGSLPSSVLS
jgi:hypothetical protein